MPAPRLARLCADCPPPRAHIAVLAAQATEILMEEGNVVGVPIPVTIVGDIHGQLHDLIELFNISGKCPDTNFVFLGARAAPQRRARASTGAGSVTGLGCAHSP